MPRRRPGGGPRRAASATAVPRPGSAAAAVGSNSAAGAQPATGRPVMAIGGFNGSDTAQQISAGVAANSSASRVGG
jgi:hypothetical protein